VADVFDQLLPRVHVQAFQSHLEGLPVDAFGRDALAVLQVGAAHDGDLFEGFVEVVEVVDLIPVESVFFDEVGYVLGAEQTVFAVQPGQHVPLGDRGLERTDLASGPGPLGVLPADVLHHEVDPLGDELVAVGGGGQLLDLVVGQFEHFAVDDFLGVVALGFEEQVLVAFLYAVLVRLVLLVVPVRQFVAGLAGRRQFVVRVLGQFIHVRFHIFDSLVVVDFLLFVCTLLATFTQSASEQLAL
jgi:hypothetical protein